MAAKDFDFSTQTTKDIGEQQAIVAIDNGADIELLEKTLKSDGIRIISKGKDGNEAMEVARKHKAGMFFLDYDINALGSNGVLSKLKVEYGNIKVIVVAKLLNKVQVSDARKLGVVGFLAKPLTADAINKLLEKIK